ncbi:hypothetical protein MMC13_002724 [Lambiella insularis]|nr:hypothetical protein [Lambiella insularis]
MASQQRLLQDMSGATQQSLVSPDPPAPSLLSFLRLPRWICGDKFEIRRLIYHHIFSKYRLGWIFLFGAVACGGMFGHGPESKAMWPLLCSNKEVHEEAEQVFYSTFELAIVSMESSTVHEFADCLTDRLSDRAWSLVETVELRLLSLVGKSILHAPKGTNSVMSRGDNDLCQRSLEMIIVVMDRCAALRELSILIPFLSNLILILLPSSLHEDSTIAECENPAVVSFLVASLSQLEHVEKVISYKDTHWWKVELIKECKEPVTLG